MIDVLTFDVNGKRIDAAEAADPAAAIVAGRTLWDDATGANRVQGYRVSVGFFVNGRLVRMTDGRP